MASPRPTRRPSGQFLRLRAVTQALEWPGSGTRIAGVSSFGFGGTNAHVVLEGAPPAPPVPVHRGAIALPLSARSRPALERSLHTWNGLLATATADDVAALAYTAATRRTHHLPFRAAIVADDARALPKR